MDDAPLRAAYARAMTARGADRAGCPAPEALRDLATSTVVAESDAGAFDHVMSCAACRDEYELLRSIHRAGAQAPAVRARRWTPLALAATMLLAVGLGSAILLRRDGMRGIADAVQLVTPGRVAPGEPLPLAWHPVDGATAYRAELLDEVGAPLFSTTTGDTAVVVPAGTIAPGTRVVDFLVVATRADGSQRRSAMVRVPLAP